MHTHKFVAKRKYVHETLCPKEVFEPKSFRSVKAKEHVITIGCPKGKYKAGLCTVGTRAQRILHAKVHFKAKFPTKYKKAAAAGRKGVYLVASKTIKPYCPS